MREGFGVDLQIGFREAYDFNWSNSRKLKDEAITRAIGAVGYLFDAKGFEITYP